VHTASEERICLNVCHNRGAHFRRGEVLGLLKFADGTANLDLTGAMIPTEFVLDLLLPRLHYLKNVEIKHSV